MVYVIGHHYHGHIDKTWLLKQLLVMLVRRITSSKLGHHKQHHKHGTTKNWTLLVMLMDDRIYYLMSCTLQGT